MNCKRKHLFALAPLALFVACSSAPLSDPAQKIDPEQSLSSSMPVTTSQPGNSTRSSTVQMQDDLWVGGNAIKISNESPLPDFFSNPAYFYQAQPAGFEQIVERLSLEFGTKIVTSSDAAEYLQFLEGQINSGIQFTIEHAGTVGSVLDQLAAKANLFWKWDNGQITFYRNETKTFIVDLLPGESSFTAVVGNASAQNSAAAYHATTISSALGSAWENLALSVASMVSSSGRFALSEQIGTLTITDTPTAIEKVESYVDSVNATTGRKIAVRTEVYEVAVDADGGSWFNWASVLEDSQGTEQERITGPGVSVIGLQSKFKNTEALMAAVSENARVSLITSSSTYTTNGKPVPVQVIEETTYLASVGNQPGATPNQAVLTPGVISSGLSMSLLPKIESDGDIMMQVTMDISELNGISSFGSGGSKIQLPSKSSKTFLQRASLRSGETLVMSGFESPSSRSRSLGARQKYMTVILITPYLIE